MFYLTGLKIRYKEVLSRHLTGTRNGKKKEKKAVSLSEND